MAVTWAATRWGGARDFEEYVEAVRFKNGRIPFLSTAWRTLSSAFSIATGAAIGREGSMIQFAAAFSSWCASRDKHPPASLANQVAWGAAAAVAAAYQAPVAGVFFASEIVVGKIIAAEIVPLLVSAFVGATISRSVFGGNPLFVATQPIRLDARQVAIGLAAAVLIGSLGPAYVKLTRSLRKARNWPVALVWSGALVGILSLSRPEVWGNGDVALRAIMQTDSASWPVFSILAFRLCATTFCVGTGTVGGVFTPTLFAGSAAGLLAANLLHSGTPVLFAIIGMGALLSAATQAPFMATFMTIELTGQWSLLPLLLLVSVAAWQVSRRLSPHSLYALATPEPSVKISEPKPSASRLSNLTVGGAESVEETR
jgi:CIC family chloride channel protein